MSDRSKTALIENFDQLYYANHLHRIFPQAQYLRLARDANVEHLIAASKGTALCKKISTPALDC